MRVVFVLHGVCIKVVLLIGLVFYVEAGRRCYPLQLGGWGVTVKNERLFLLEVALQSSLTVREFLFISTLN